MAVQHRGNFGHPNKGKHIGPGPFLARIVNHLDPTYMGSLEVTIIKAVPGVGTTETVNVIVKYCSPFFGATSVKYEGNNSANFDDVQKSYGFWMVPPDIGSTVMVMFIDGDINQGYWFGCVPDMYQDQMVPGIAASRYSALTQEQKDKYGTDLVPVAEYHKSSRGMEDPNPDKFTKPVHPFADRLVQQGLLIDTIRGVTSSSARREVPSRVFGISTPGPVDTASPMKVAGFDNGGNNILLPVSRLGGHQFVMDDGDADGKNELFRIRTRTGHQILLHNSSDLIYIGNSRGTAWIELTSDGKIDVFAQDSVSIHTEEDFNFRADRDINLEAGRNLNIKANSGIEMNCVDRYYLICDNVGKIQFGDSFNLSASNEIRMQSGSNSSYLSGADFFANSTGNMNLGAGAAMKQSSVGDFNESAGGNHVESASQIHMNGPSASPADNGTVADTPIPLELFSLPNRDPARGWANRNFYRTSSTIVTIMQRVPTHEPYDQHENVNPAQFNSSGTDVQVTGPIDMKPTPFNSGTNTPPSNLSPIAPPLSKSAAANEEYLKKVLIQGGVTDPIKLAAWMAQCKQESGGFRYLKELGPDSYFNRYDGRKDLGNTQPGDGALYKGRGFIQITGKNAYASMSKYFGQDVVSHPELVEQLPLASQSVLWFFNVEKASRSSTINWDDCVAVTKLVNGGTNGLSNRQQYYAAYKQQYTTQGIGS